MAKKVNPAHRILINNFMWLMAKSYAENIHVVDDGKPEIRVWLDAVIEQADQQELKSMGGFIKVIQNLRKIIMRYELISQMEAFMTLCDDYDLPELFGVFSGMRKLLLENENREDAEFEVHPNTLKLITATKRAIIEPNRFRYR